MPTAYSKGFPTIGFKTNMGQTMMSKGQSCNFRESMRMEEEGMKRSDYFSLRKEGPLKNYPMASQRSNFISSEFKILDRLLHKKEELR